MGGWLMLLATKVRKKRIVGLLGIATATDFANDIYKQLLQTQTETTVVKTPIHDHKVNCLSISTGSNQVSTLEFSFQKLASKL